MSYMTWSRHFLTGLPSVDAQHENLVALVNEVAPHLVEGVATDPKEAGEILSRLFEYADSHFRDEEALMAEEGLDPAYLERHREIHNAFVIEVLALHSRLLAGELEGPRLLKLLSGWLTIHILGEDQTMARQVVAIRSGMSAGAAREAAHEAEEEDSAHAVLNAALLDLYALDQVRTRELARSNAELKALGAELERINAGLEATVAQRTQALTLANATLEAERRQLRQALDELGQAQAALIEAAKLRSVGQLAAGLAHELNSPLQVVSDSVGFIGEGLDALSAAQRALEDRVPSGAAQEVAQAHDLPFFAEELPGARQRADRGLARASELVRAMLEFSSSSNGEPVSMNLVALLENTALVAAGQLDGLPLELDLRPVPAVRCHPAELRQAVLNLLLNARDAVREVRRTDPNRGRLRVRLFAEAKHAVIEIVDDGAGIDPAIADRVYDPFFTTREVGAGVGQGLTVTRAVVKDLHRGDLSFESTPGGTTFRVRLPLSS